MARAAAGGKGGQEACAWNAYAQAEAAGRGERTGGTKQEAIDEEARTRRGGAKERRQRGKQGRSRGEERK
eukprot:4892049-Alexandrium_andersonii.AAC.1